MWFRHFCTFANWSLLYMKAVDLRISIIFQIWSQHTNHELFVIIAVSLVIDLCAAKHPKSLKIKKAQMNKSEFKAIFLDICYFVCFQRLPNLLFGNFQNPSWAGVKKKTRSLESSRVYLSSRQGVVIRRAYLLHLALCDLFKRKIQSPLKQKRRSSWIPCRCRKRTYSIFSATVNLSKLVYNSLFSNIITCNTKTKLFTRSLFYDFTILQI